MKHKDNLKSEIIQLSEYVLELSKDIESKPKLILFRLLLTKNLITQLENKLKENITPKEFKEVEKMVNETHKNIEVGVIHITK